MDRGARWGTVLGVSKSQTQLKQLSHLAHTQSKKQIGVAASKIIPFGHSCFDSLHHVKFISETVSENRSSKKKMFFSGD